MVFSYIRASNIPRRTHGLLRCRDHAASDATPQAGGLPDDVLQKIMDAAICAPSGGNRQNWSFVVVRDRAKRARLGELYREAWSELMKVPYYAGASKEPADSPAGKMLGSARHLAEHLGEAPAIILACVTLDPGVKANLTTGASIYPAVQ